MIATEIGRGRKFVGALEVNSDLLAGLEELCRKNEVVCGHLRALGYVKDPVFRRYSRAQSSYLPDESFDGLYQLATCEGFVSLGDHDQLDFLLHCVSSASEAGRNKIIVGQLVKAQVLQFEFVLETFEGVSFKRLSDPNTGLNMWLQVLPSQLEGREGLDLAADGGGDVRFFHSDAEEIDLEDVELERGDWLDHPRLGKCLVLAPDNDERVPVKLPSGRVAELHLGMFRLFRVGRTDGGTLYKVEVRRKKS